MLNLFNIAQSYIYITQETWIGLNNLNVCELGFLMK